MIKGINMLKEHQLVECECKNKLFNHYCLKCNLEVESDLREFRKKLLDCSFELIFKCIERYKEIYRILEQKVTIEELNELEKEYKDFYDDIKNGRVSKEKETLFLDRIIFKHMKRILKQMNSELYTYLKENSDILEGYTDERAKYLWNLIDGMVGKSIIW
ncbi:MAG: hypothetical protein ACE5K4_00960 [Candidatus Hydrothermarchaeota archaeon]